MNLQIGILAGLGSMIGWGTADFFAAKASKKIGNFPALFWPTIGSLILMTIYLLRFPDQFNFSFQAFWPMCLVGLLQAIGGISFYRAFEIGKVSLVSPIASSWGLWTSLLSIVFLKEILLPFQIIGILLITSGLILVSVKKQQFIKDKKLMLSDPGVKLAFLCSFFWGISWIFYKIVIDQFGWLSSTLLLYLFFLFWIFLYSRIFKKTIKFKMEKSITILFILISTINMGAYFAYSLGLEKGLVSIVSPIAATFPLITILLARVFFKEKLVWNQIFGIIGIIGGLFLLSF